MPLSAPQRLASRTHPNHLEESITRSTPSVSATRRWNCSAGPARSRSQTGHGSSPHEQTRCACSGRRGWNAATASPHENASAGVPSMRSSIVVPDRPCPHTLTSVAGAMPGRSYLGWSGPSPGRISPTRSRGLVERQEPARPDLPLGHVVETDGRPPARDTADRGRAVGQRRDAPTLPDKHIAPVHQEGPVREVAAAAEVAEDRVDAAVGAGDGARSRHRPHHRAAEQVLERRPRPAAVERVLRLVQPVEQGDGAIAVHVAVAGRGTTVRSQRRLPSRIIAGYTIRCRNGPIAAR